jgi:predicted secreted hydrolase
MITRIFTSLFLLLGLFWTNTVTGQDYRDVTPGQAVKLPDDFYYKKDFRVQWWYLTGHLFDEEGREFGYELTFFAIGVQKREFESRFGPQNVYASHFAVSDISAKEFFYKSDADVGAFGFAGAREDSLNVWVGNNFLIQATDKMHIAGSAENVSLTLWLTPVKPAVLHGNRGYSRKSSESPLSASLYFSYTNLETKGTLKSGGRVFTLKGKSWFDREISSREPGEDFKGWDWFSLQLDDGREIMLYLIRKKDGSTDQFSSGTFVYADGSYRHLSRNDFAISALSHYRSKKTGSRYPSGWRISIPSEKLELSVSPQMEDQELIAGFSMWSHYWEGSCTVSGNATGRAYVEMTGY